MTGQNISYVNATRVNIINYKSRIDNDCGLLVSQWLPCPHATWNCLLSIAIT